MGSPLLGNITGGIFGGRNKDQTQSQGQPEPTLGSTPVDSTATQLANTPITPQQQNICITDPTKCQFDLLKVKEDIKLQESLPKQNIKTSFTFSEVMTCNDGQGKNPTLTSGYGNRIHPITGILTFHRGIDLGCGGTGTITSPVSGKVLWAGFKNDGYGVSILIADSNKMIWGFNHLSQATVKAGDSVEAGQMIGKEGNTGIGTAPHLHVYTVQKGTNIISGIYQQPNHINPLNFLKM